MRLITLYLPEPWIQKLDGLAERIGDSRADLIRTAIRDFLKVEGVWN